MSPLEHTARRFPLVARARPACLPLGARVDHLAHLADQAAATRGFVTASLVLNQAALLASDVGLPDLARALCHRHAAAYLHACPLDGATAIRALEPIVNLARLNIRTGHPDEGHRQLLALLDAASKGHPVDIDGTTIPAGLTTDTGRAAVRAWLWAVLLSDGTRALTSMGRWAQARTHLQSHRGIGTRMLDGRQVAILAALHAAAYGDAQTLLDSTTPGEAWEQHVTGCLRVLSRQAQHLDSAPLLGDLIETHVQGSVPEGLIVFSTRLGLTLLDMTPDPAAAHRLAAVLYGRIAATRDGYAARELLADRAFLEQATAAQIRECREVLRASALDGLGVEKHVLAALNAALNRAEQILCSAMTQACTIGQE
ncbi:hypothetical protein [Streptomyces sp. BH055]|uniref:hypothetical protein n=1 Tax=unclassified Streptomyces TaxID=2593676 RepID=UPI003BB5CCF6